MRCWKLLVVLICAWPWAGAFGEPLVPSASPSSSPSSGAGPSSPVSPLPVAGDSRSDGLERVLARAAKGDAEAQLQAAQYYYDGKQTNPELAVRYLKQAAEAGNGEAIGVLGCWTIEGKVVPRDVENGERLLRRAAAMGGARAQNNLGRTLAERGVEKEALEWFRKAAGQDFALAEMNMARAYETGFGVEKDETERIKWLERAGNHGVPLAMQWVAEYYTAPVGGVPRDTVKAVEWTRKAAAAGVACAQTNLGMRCFRGDGLLRDTREALRWFRVAAEHGDAFGQHCLAGAYFEGMEVEKDLSLAAYWFRKAADSGYAEAQFSFGVLCFFGMGVPKDVNKGLEWIAKAADGGSHRAELCLGETYWKGIEVPRDMPRGMVYLRKAAEAGDALAQYFLSTAYNRGDVVEKNPDLAMEWCRRSAQRGFPAAQRQYALFLNEASFDTKGKAEAAEWMRKAAENGDPVAQFQYGIWCVQGDCGLEADPTEGVRWLRFSALQGFANAEAFYGHSLDSATGCERDYVEAYKWYTLAIQHADDPGLKRATGVNLQTLLLRLTPEQIEEGKKRVEKFVPVRDKRNNDDPFAIGLG